MKKRFSSLLLLLFLIINSFQVEASQAGKHSHNVAYAKLIFQEQRLHIHVTIPSIAFFGFEHQPSTIKEVKHVVDTTEKYKTASIFKFYSKGSLFKKNKLIKLEMDNGKTSVLEASSDSQNETPDEHHDEHHDENHDEHHDEHHDHGDEVSSDQHSDFVIEQVFILPKDFNLASISTSFFNEFSTINELDLIVISHDNQEEYKLTKEQSTIKVGGLL